MNNKPPAYILDSFAVLALLEDENGSERIQAILQTAENIPVHLSIINLGEVLYITERERGLPAAQKTLSVIEQLPIEVLPATQERVLAAAHIKANYPIAYADAFAAAAAQEFNAPVVTGDPEFTQIETIVQVEWLPKKR